MPELPDVEVFRGYIDATALHQSIRRVEVHDTDVLADCSGAKLKRHLSGTAFETTRRHGKHLGVQLDSGEWLLLHFGMTGDLEYAKGDGDPPAHSRVVLQFTNGHRLAYINPRKLGRVRLADDFDAFVSEQDLGPDVLAIERDAFADLLSSGRGMLKSRLMNQQLLAGMGNVYTDEVFFQAGIDPETRTEEVTSESAAELWRTMRRVLRTAIDRGARPERFPESWLTPHREGEQCPRCRGRLETTKIGGRTTHYCPACQSASS